MCYTGKCPHEDDMGNCMVEESPFPCPGPDDDSDEPENKDDPPF